MKRLASALLVAGAAAHAADVDTPSAFEDQMEEARAEVGAQLQLQAYDLLDELVFGWVKAPPFKEDTPVVLADVTVPVGFGSGLQALIENHLVSLLTQNPRTHVQLVHCPQCTSMVVHSGAKGTVVARGVDSPEALVQAGVASGSRRALFLDFEIEGSVLVLRARMTSLEVKLPIVWARTLTTTSHSPALLRAPDKLKSAAEARKEYLDLLEGKGIILVPISLAVRTYKAKENVPLGAPPTIWLQVGLEASLSQARAWTAGFSAGFTWTPQSHVGWSLQARVARLITGNVVSLTHPDLYVFMGGAVMSLYGTGALAFKDQIPTPAEIRDPNATPNAIFGAVHLGILMRLKNRIGAAFYAEWSPAFDGSPLLANYIDLGVKIHALGVEVQFCF